jgi:hypothetical protein
VLVLAVGGAAAGLAARRERLVQLIGGAGLIAAATYLVTPKTAGGPLHHPFLFAIDLRFLAPALMLGLLAAALALPLPRVRWARWAIALAALAIAAFGLDYHEIATHPVGAALGAGAVVVALGGAALARSAPPARVVGAALARSSPPARMVAATALLAGFAVPLGLAVAALERHGRYSDRASPIRVAWAWANGVHHQRIALAGSFQQYPFYGADLSNRVQWLGQRGARGSFGPEQTCEQWRAALARGHYQYAIISHVTVRNPLHYRVPELDWTRSDPAATLILNRGERFSIFALRQPPPGAESAGCNTVLSGRQQAFPL